MDECKYFGYDDIDFWCEYPDGQHKCAKICDYDRYNHDECPRMIHNGKDTQKMKDDFRKKQKKEWMNHLEESKKIVESWPKWKRDYLRGYMFERNNNV